jgi:hypothetical protein
MSGITWPVSGVRKASVIRTVKSGFSKTLKMGSSYFARLLVLKRDTAPQSPGPRARLC